MKAAFTQLTCSHEFARPEGLAFQVVRHDQSQRQVQSGLWPRWRTGKKVCKVDLIWTIKYKEGVMATCRDVCG